MNKQKQIPSTAFTQMPSFFFWKREKTKTNPKCSASKEIKALWCVCVFLYWINENFF